MGVEPIEQSLALQPSVLGAAWRFRLLVVSSMGIGAVLTMVFLTARPIQYEAVATVVFEDPSAAVLPTAGASQRFDRFVSTQMQVLQSGTLARRASEIARENGSDLSPRDLLRGTDISNVRNTDVVRIGFQANSEEASLVGADAIVEAYRQVRQEQLLAEAADILERLDAAARVIEGDLADVSSEIASVSVGATTRGDLDDRLAATSASILAVQAQLAATTDPDLGDALDERLFDLREQLEALQEVIELASRRPELASLLRDQQAALDLRADLTARRNEVEIEAETAGSGFSFVSNAALTDSAGPAAGRLFTLAGGALFGGLIGIGLAYYVAVRRRSFSNRLEPELMLGAPLLAEIPDFADEGVDSGAPVRDAPRSLSAEAFRFAASNLDIRMEAGGHRVVVLVSATIGEGKTVVAANTAVASARTGRRVLVVDADFGHQALTSLLLGAIADRPGLTEVVESQLELERAVVRVQIGSDTKVDLLGRGMRPVVAPDFFRSAGSRAFFDQVRKGYDLVLVDTPPLLQVAYAGTLVRLADLVVVTVPSGGQVRLLEEVAERLRFLGTPVAGYIYNRAPLRRDMMASEGSMKDVLGDRGQVVEVHKR